MSPWLNSAQLTFELPSVMMMPLAIMTGRFAGSGNNYILV
jgi:hypothetical protein